MTKITRRNFLKKWQLAVGTFATAITAPSLFYWWWDRSGQPTDIENWIDLGKAKKDYRK